MPKRKRSTDTQGHSLAKTILKASGISELIDALKNGETRFAVKVPESARSFFAAAVHCALKDIPMILVTVGVRSQEILDQDLRTWLEVFSNGSKKAATDPDPEVLFFPAWEFLPHEPKLPHADVISERLETLVSLNRFRTTPHSLSAPMVVTHIRALMQPSFSPDELSNRTRILKTGDQCDPLDLIEWLEDQGYEPEAQVTLKGEIALRGGILDVFPLTSPHPIRLEFFGEDLESIRIFDASSQISLKKVDEIELTPAGEIGILKKLIEEQKDVIAGKDCSADLLDHLPDGCLVLFFDPEDVETAGLEYESRLMDGGPLARTWDQLLQKMAEKGVAVSSLISDAVKDPAESELPSVHDLEPIVLDAGFSSLDDYGTVSESRLDFRILEPRRHEFLNQIQRWQRQDYQVLVFGNNKGELQRFQEIWEEVIAKPESTPKKKPSVKKKVKSEIQSKNACPLKLLSYPLSQGFLFQVGKIVVVTDAEIFGRYKVSKPRRLKSRHALAARRTLDVDFTDLEHGDYVVHVQHGIGRFTGLRIVDIQSSGKGKPVSEKSKLRSTGQECMVIEYASRDTNSPPPKLYVPVTEAHLVGKYIGAGKARPPLNKLGGARWSKTTESAQKSIMDLASQLISLQAARESQKGHQFEPDTPWQREFESAFIYEETLDQQRAIDETKTDLEAEKPMDRLICGDVGYGKTEVAIRAAFKAVMGGKQVAILVPTTVLAAQHHNTLSERMSDYPIRVELLSRFRSNKQQLEVVSGLANGSVDIVIGTHRLIQKDIVFQDLGLVVVDEEQRFGVLHKEKLKVLRKTVDVLTLTATPIPRTLYMALSGARDMSTIETPPQDRLPVETLVLPYNERTIRDAIQQELDRDGQVYFLHNRIHDIHSVALRVKALVPKAKVVVGHGQMPARDLEKIMNQFVNGEADVLLSTTIIESGLDIPNANTIIIDRADRFGLSDLYQLRGRVGRYKHQAYAYLLLPRHAALLDNVRKRLSAIKQYSTLGSGFKIAMRDLEIRGAGNLLGPQQSGHIAAVGFDLYCQLLKKSIRALKGEKVKPRIEVYLKLDFVRFSPLETPETQTGNVVKDSVYEAEESMQIVSALAPYRFAEEEKHRIEIYRKMALADDKASLNRLKAELKDRFGVLPEPLELLFTLAALKLLASDCQVSSIETRQDRIMLFRNGDYLTIDGRFPRLKRKDPKGKLNEVRRLLTAL